MQITEENLLDEDKGRSGDEQGRQRENGVETDGIKDRRTKTDRRTTKQNKRQENETDTDRQKTKQENDE